MSRTGKKIVYGVFYLGVLFLILFGVYKAIFKVAPTCFDTIQNQNETGVDCGGICGSCEILNLAPIRTVGEVKIFGLSSGKAVLVAEIENSNLGYDASFSYALKIYDHNKNLIETRRGRETIFQSERKIIYDSEITSAFPKIFRTQAEISDIEWLPVESGTKPDLSVTGISTVVEDEAVKINGGVKNKSAFAAHGIAVTAFIADEFGFELFASKTFLEDLQGFSEKSFLISFPAEQSWLGQIQPRATRVFVSSSL